MTDREKMVFLSALAREKQAWKRMDYEKQDTPPFIIEMIEVCERVKQMVMDSFLWDE